MSDEPLSDTTTPERSHDPSLTRPSVDCAESALEKTQVEISSVELQNALARAEASDSETVSRADFTLVKYELMRKIVDANRLQNKVDDLTVRLEALRNDFSTQAAETQEELDTHRTILDRSTESSHELETQLSQAHKDNKELKAQNLKLQYHLSEWGLPTEIDGPATEHPDLEGSRSKAFFPPLVAPEGMEDPVPIVLKGDLNTFYFPNLIHFLSNSNLLGVLTVVAEGIVSKLYLDRGVLRLASWNNREASLSLTALLRASELAPTSALDQLAQLPLFDLEIASILVRQKFVETPELRRGLREHARVILSFLFELGRGTFLFQPGRVEEMEHLQFELSVIDVLLHTAAEVDERSRG